MTLYLTRRYRFSASHRLHSGALTEEENARIFGKCNSPYGHGHNYALEVTVAGPVDPATGMVFDLARLDSLVREQVLDTLDHTHLNLDVEAFQRTPPTTENLCVEIYRMLAEPWRRFAVGSSARLKKVRLEETSSNYFECEEP